MPKGILLVESRPVSPDKDAEYNRWYDETHLKEVTSLPGFLGARRFKPVERGGPYVAVYELEADDLSGCIAALGEAAQAGQIHMTDAMELDPAPVVRLLETTTDYPG